jgi:hypothetical protein
MEGWGLDLLLLTDKVGDMLRSTGKLKRNTLDEMH